jgi:hypothetical protein
MYVYRSRFLLRGEVWYAGEPDDSAVDWVVYHQRPSPVPRARWKYFYTRLINLNQTPEALLGQMSSSTAYKIRRARDRDGVGCHGCDTSKPEVIDEFEQVYNRFAAGKGLPSLDPAELNLLAKAGALEISVARDGQGNPLVYHAYYRDSSRSRLLHSASHYREIDDSSVRNTIGRANRYLFWWDMLRHREQGLKTFDFGGWYPGNEDAGLLEVNRFKEGFGGRVVREYNCEQIRSLKGWVVLNTAWCLQKARARQWLGEASQLLRKRPKLLPAG